MNTKKLLPQITRRVFARANHLLAGLQPCVLAAALGMVPWLVPSARADLKGTFVEGPAEAANSFNLTVEFLNGDYYDFVLRSTEPTISGFDLINTVASLTPGMTVDQVGPSKYGYYIDKITILTDTNTGFGGNYWANWNGDSSNPIQWSFAQVGESSTVIKPGEADGWVFSDGSNPPQATAIPEPSAWILVAFAVTGGLVVGWRRRVGPVLT